MAIGESAPAPVVVAVSGSGAPVARRVANTLGAALHGRAGRVEGADVTFPDALEHVRTLFAAGVPVVGVCAAGILIRAVAPLLADKSTEPPVVAISDNGGVVIPLLGGHWGANRLAQKLAEALGAVSAVTTAGEVALGVALDAPPEGYRLANPEDAREAMATLLSGGQAKVEGPALFDLPGARQTETGGASSGPPAAMAMEAAGARVPGSPPVSGGAARPGGTAGEVTLTVTERPEPGGVGRLVYHPRHHVIGVGSARGAAPEALWDEVSAMLAAADVAPGAVAAVATLDLKADEAAMNALATRLDVPLRLFTAAELEAEAPRLATPSEVVFAEVGCHGVAEGAALAAAGPEAALVVPKRKGGEVTCALARAPAPLTTLAGRPRGHVAVVGIGPGQASWRTPEASRLVAQAEELVGYGLYLDLLGPLAAGKPRAEFPLGGEEDRCRHALERAGDGARVALVCSGDAGIYAMAALVYELLDRPDAVSDAARRAEVVVAPGVSALQAAAARAGAPLGHDFCAISLSDLLTPREDILRRVRAAAEGDFVVAFYNPVSRRRRTLLAEARDALIKARGADAPVILAASLGRPEERVWVRRLGDLTVDEVDMLTVVIVGSSQSRVVDTGDGPRAYTPRGYAAKHHPSGIGDTDT